MVPHLCLQGGGLSPSWVRRPGQLLLFLLALLLVARFPRLGDTKRTHASANYSNVLEDSSARNLSQSTQLAFVEAGEPKSKAAAPRDIPDDVSAADLLQWAKDPAGQGLAPPYPVQLVPCGQQREALLYSTYGGHSGTPESILQAYKFHASNYQRSRRSLRETMLKSEHYESLRMLFIQWNAEFLHPLAWEILQAVIPTDENKVDVNAVDALFITLQENNGRSEAEHRAFLKKLVSGLNALSKHHTWNLDSAAFVELRNVIGTKMSAQGRKANHQTIYFIGRSHLPRAAIDECQWAYNKREKGFVGISVAFSDVGRVLVLGSHLPTSKENARKFVQELLDQIVRQCIPKEYRSEGLGFYGGGVYLLGDFNTRFSNESAVKVLGLLKKNAEYKDLYKLPPPEPSTTVEAQQLKHILDYEGSDKEERFAHLLWAMDTLGGSNEVEGTAGDVRTSLINKGFGFVSTCYTGPYSYSWRKGCELESVPKLAELSKRCLNPKSERRPSDTGFLDRLVARVIPESRSVLSMEHIHGHMPVIDAFITFSGQLTNLRSDHLPQVFVVQLLRMSRPRLRSRSAAPLSRKAQHRKAWIHRTTSLDASEA